MKRGKGESRSCSKSQNRLQGYLFLIRHLVQAVACLLIAIPASGQQLSLQRCMELAKDRNNNLKISGYDVAIAQKKLSERYGVLLPQVDNTTSYSDNLKMSTTLLPGELMGKEKGSYIPVQMGSKMALNSGFTVSQKLIDFQSVYDVRSAKVSYLKEESTLQQTYEQVVYNIGKAYYQAVVSLMQVEVLRQTLSASEKSLLYSEEKLRNGLVKQLDVDKVRVSTSNTSTQLKQSRLTYEKSLINLKYYVGIPLDSTVTLSDTALSADSAILTGFVPGNLNVEKVSDFRLQQTEVELQRIEYKKQVSGYLPTLSFTYQYGYSSMGNQFNFLSNDAKWYSSSSIGLSLKVPLFGGLQKRQKVTQARMALSKAQEQLTLTERNINRSYMDYEIELRNAMEDIRYQQENLLLSQKVYADTQTQYQEGTGTSVDLVQAESSLRESQSNYFNKLLTLYIARLDLEQSKGQLLEYFKIK